MDRLREAVRSSFVQEPMEIETGSLVGRCRFEADFPGFSGHFPGGPILPAVVQIAAALQAAAMVWKDAPSGAVSVHKAKFVLPVKPGDEIEIHCSRTSVAGAQGLEARVLVRGEPASSFTVTTGPGEGGS